MISDVDMLCKLGKIKYQLMKTDPLRFFVRAFMAGAYLGLAAILSYTLGAKYGIASSHCQFPL